ncbi:MAG: hypothetical protein M1830_004788 [Pleopsidium flavum]|nr:MAG: hypothetical protein M1830_004788 [Pleopsidium flavum]
MVCNFFTRAKDNNGEERIRISLIELPVEILQFIASLLPVSSAASLALCNHSICHAIGTQFWHALRREDQSNPKLDFLLCLERDLRSFILCHRCLKLHRRDPVEGPKQRYYGNRERQCVKEDGVLRNYAFDYNMKYKHVRLVMNAQRSGPSHGIPLDALRHVWSRKNSNLKVWLEPRIVADELLLRARSRVLMHFEREFKHVKKYILKICPHLTAHDDDNLLAHLITCRLSHLDNRPCLFCDGLRQCRSCPTEFQVEIEDLGEAGVAVLVTAWNNLGSGRSPSDPKWRAHIYRSQNNQMRAESFQYEPGSIQTAFEQKENITSGVYYHGKAFRIRSPMRFVRQVFRV